MARRALLALAVVLAPCLARADETPVAEQLFLMGKGLMSEHRYEEACAKFKASHDLDKTATGTLLNLALCHEQLGKLATAWAEYRQVIAESTGKREDRVTFAQEHIAKVGPLLSFVTIVVPSEARADGLYVQLDGDKIAPAAWGTELPIDPGEHVVEAGAPKKVTAKDKVVIAGDAQHSRLVVRPLADVPFVVEPPPPDDTTRRTIGWSLAGAGAAGIGAGLVFGLMARNLESKAKGRCDDFQCASDTDARIASNEHDDAKRWATVSTVVVIVSAAAIAGGLALVLTSSRAQTSAFVVPGGLVVRGDL